MDGYKGREVIATRPLAPHAIDYGLHTKIVRKTADETIQNDDTLSSDSELIFPLLANEVWHIWMVIYLDSHSAADFKMKWSAPSGATAYSGHHIAAAGVFSHAAEYASGTNAIWPFTVSTIVICGATAGNLVFQWAQNISNANNTTVLEHACMIATQLV